jgi:hypothetical protein
MRSDTDKRGATYRCCAAKHLSRAAKPVDDLVLMTVLPYIAKLGMKVIDTPVDIAALISEKKLLSDALDEIADMEQADEITPGRSAK